MIQCDPHEGRHPRVLDVQNLDEIISSLELPPNDQCFKSLTSASDPNTRIDFRESVSIDKSLTCFNYALDLVVNAGLNSVAKIRQAVERFEKMSSECHKSNLYCERIRRACTDLNIAGKNPGETNLTTFMGVRRNSLRGVGRQWSILPKIMQNQKI